jgi:hypothetical protein
MTYEFSDEQFEEASKAILDSWFAILHDFHDNDVVTLHAIKPLGEHEHYFDPTKSPYGKVMARYKMTKLDKLAGYFEKKIKDSIYAEIGARISLDITEKGHLIVTGRLAPHHGDKKNDPNK